MAIRVLQILQIVKGKFVLWKGNAKELFLSSSKTKLVPLAGILIIGVVSLLSPMLIAQYQNILTHASNSAYSTCIPFVTGDPINTEINYCNFKKVTFFGDSLTEGYFASSDSEDFRNQTLRLLHAKDERYPSSSSCSDGSGICIGGETLQTLKNTQGQILTGELAIVESNKRYIPVKNDIIVVELGTNDWNYITNLNTDAEKFGSAYRQFTNLVTSQSQNVKLVCLTVWQNPSDPRTTAINKAIINNCITHTGVHGIPVNISSLFADPTNRGPYGRTSFLATAKVPSDDFHPNNKGHLLIADRIFGALASYIQNFKISNKKAQPSGTNNTNPSNDGFQAINRRNNSSTTKIQIYSGSTSPTGYINHPLVCSSSIGGWACVPSAPNASVRVDLYVDGTYQNCGTGCFVMSAVANEPGQNSSDQAGIAHYCGGTSNHRFNFPLDSSQEEKIMNGRSHTIYVYAIGGKNPLLSWSGETLMCGNSQTNTYNTNTSASGSPTSTNSYIRNKDSSYLRGY